MGIRETAFDSRVIPLIEYAFQRFLSLLFAWKWVLGLGRESTQRSFEVQGALPVRTNEAWTDRNFSIGSAGRIFRPVLVSPWTTSRSANPVQHRTSCACACSGQRVCRVDLPKESLDHIASSRVRKRWQVSTGVFSARNGLVPRNKACVDAPQGAVQRTRYRGHIRTSTQSHVSPLRRVRPGSIRRRYFDCTYCLWMACVDSSRTRQHRKVHAAINFILQFTTGLEQQ